MIEKETATSRSVSLAVVQRLRYSDPVSGRKPVGLLPRSDRQPDDSGHLTGRCWLMISRWVPFQDLCVAGDHVLHQPALFAAVGRRFAAHQRRCCLPVAGEVLGNIVKAVNNL